ncbi:hypothetical protein FQZ97_930670 [compost metagenome]
MAYHLDPLAFPTRQGRAFAIKAEITEADGDKVFQPQREGFQHRPHLRRADLAHQLGQLAHLHRRELGDIVAFHLAVERLLIEPRALADRAGGAGKDAFIFEPHMGLQGFRVLGAQPFLELGDDTLIGDVDLADLHLAPVIEVEQHFALFGGKIPDRLVDIEQARIEVGARPPAFDFKPLGQQRALVERFALVDHCAHIHGGDLPDPLAIGAHAARIVIGIKAGRTQLGLAEAREQYAQHLRRVGHRGDGGA